MLLLVASATAGDIKATQYSISNVSIRRCQIVISRINHNIRQYKIKSKKETISFNSIRISKEVLAGITSLYIENELFP
jgi:hypothetical protein